MRERKGELDTGTNCHSLVKKLIPTDYHHFTIDAIIFLYCHSYFPSIFTFPSNLSISAPLCLSQTYARIFVRYLSISSLIFLLPNPSFLLALLSYYRPSFLPSFLLSFLLSFLPSFLPFFLPTFVPSFPPFFLPSFLPFSLPSLLTYLLTYLLTLSTYLSIPSLPFLFSTIFSSSYQCMEATPSLACANKCVFCWRHHKNPVGTEWRYGNFIMLKCSTP